SSRRRSGRGRSRRAIRRRRPRSFSPQRAPWQRAGQATAARALRRSCRSSPASSTAPSAIRPAPSSAPASARRKFRPPVPEALEKEPMESPPFPCALVALRVEECRDHSAAGVKFVGPKYHFHAGKEHRLTAEERVFTELKGPMPTI